MPYIGKQPSRTAFDSDDIPNNSITSAKILDNVITADDIGNNAVGLAELSASGTASSSTFLRGDNTWANPSTAFPFYRADGSSDTITITNGEFPFFKANGSQDNIGVL